jgi:hypothetical protein
MKNLIVSLLFIILSINTYAQDWNQIIKVCASDRAGDDQFGGAVSNSGDYAIVGAPFGGTTVHSEGSAYIFKNNAGNGIEQKTIDAYDRYSNDNFSSSVSISGEYAIIGAPSEDEDVGGATTLSTAGSVYMFSTIFPEINLKGNAIAIVDGDITPSATDQTDFGNVVISANLTRTFTIENSGTGNLNVSSITVSGTSATLFTVGGITLPAIVAPSGSTTFTVKYLPNGAGVHSATINIANNEVYANPYNFDISGTGIKKDQTITFDAIPSKTYGDGTFN